MTAYTVQDGLRYRGVLQPDGRTVIMATQAPSGRWLEWAADFELAVEKLTCHGPVTRATVDVCNTIAKELWRQM